MRFTITNLREVVAEANERFPLGSPNGYGNYKRFYIDAAYGGYRVSVVHIGSTGHWDITKRGSARECANLFREWLLDNMDIWDAWKAGEDIY